MEITQLSEAQIKKMLKCCYGSWHIEQLERLRRAGYIKQTALEKARERYYGSLATLELKVSHEAITYITELEEENERLK